VPRFGDEVLGVPLDAQDESAPVFALDGFDEAVGAPRDDAYSAAPLADGLVVAAVGFE